VSRPCSICAHERRREIDSAILARASYRSIAERYGLSSPAVSRHANDHIPRLLALSYKAEETAAGDNLRAELEAEKDDIQELKREARESEDYKTALLACDKALRALEIQAKMLGHIDERPIINLHLSAEWVELRTLILTTLEAHPEARDSLVQALALEEAVNGS
jgi:hypothetical protein